VKFTTQFNLQLLGGDPHGRRHDIYHSRSRKRGRRCGRRIGLCGHRDVAVKFDLFSNAGWTTPPACTPMELSNALLRQSHRHRIDLHSGHVFKVNMTYDGTTLQVTITDTTTLAAATQSYTVNIPASWRQHGLRGLYRRHRRTRCQTYSTGPPVGDGTCHAPAGDGCLGSERWGSVGPTDPNATAVLIERKTGAAARTPRSGPRRLRRQHVHRSDSRRQHHIYRVRRQATATTQHTQTR
jgi:hypothetical protein